MDISNLGKWTFFAGIILTIGIYSLDKIVIYLGNRQYRNNRKKIEDIENWPLDKFGIKIFFQFIILITSALIIGIGSSFLFNLQSYIPIPAIKFLTYSLEDDVLPIIFTLSTVFIWNYLKKLFEWCLKPFSIFSQKQFIFIVLIWFSVSTCFAIFQGTVIFNKIINYVPESIKPLHIKIKSGEVVEDHSNLYLVTENKNIYKLKFINPQNFQIGEFVAEASMVSWWWDKKYSKNKFLNNENSIVVENNFKKYGNDKNKSKNIFSIVFIVCLIYWIFQQYNYVFIQSKIIWWVFRYKFVLKMKTALSLFSLYNTKDKKYLDWISINIHNKEDLKFIEEVMEQLKIISNINEQNENAWASKALLVAELQPPERESSKFQSIVNSINEIVDFSN